MSYINPQPGNSVTQIVVKIDRADASTITLTNGVPTAISLGSSALTIPALIDVKMKNANDIHSWSQLDSTAKYQVPTTATNEINMNLVVDPVTFFGAGGSTGVMGGSGASDTATNLGLAYLSKYKTKLAFEIHFQSVASPTTGASGDAATENIIVRGQGYITGLEPSITATAPVWVTPINIIVTGEYIFSAS